MATADTKMTAAAAHPGDRDATLELEHPMPARGQPGGQLTRGDTLWTGVANAPSPAVSRAPTRQVSAQRTQVGAVTPAKRTERRPQRAADPSQPTVT
jgi:hypothetical protein